MLLKYLFSNDYVLLIADDTDRERKLLAKNKLEKYLCRAESMKDSFLTPGMSTCGNGAISPVFSSPNKKAKVSIACVLYVIVFITCVIFPQNINFFLITFNSQSQLLIVTERLRVTKTERATYVA